MNLFKRLNKSKTVFLVLLLCLFVFMLVNNFLTPFIMDDFDYMFNFSNSEPERIVSVSQIVSSMREHRIRLNGRIVAHTIVQLVLMLPKPCFNVLNAAVFTFLIYLIYTLANHGKERNNLLLPAIFVAVWCFEPAFGQSNLWLDGSINYLWATTICILFLIPFLKRVFKGERIKSPVLQALYVIFSFLMGAYSENSSFTAIAVSALIVVVVLFIRKERVEWYYIAAILIACVGYIYMISAPGTHSQHETEWKLASLGNQFVDTMGQYKKAIPLLIAFLSMVIIGISDRMEKKTLMLACVFFIGSLLSHFVMLAASYYHGRSASTPYVFLVLADATLLAGLYRGKRKALTLCMIAAMIVVSTFEWTAGVKDIYTCNRKVQENKAKIYASIEKGKKEVKVPIVHTETPYFALYGMCYLDQETTYAYPNDAIKWYYGLDSILGYEPKS